MTDNNVYEMKFISNLSDFVENHDDLIIKFNEHQKELLQLMQELCSGINKDKRLLYVKWNRQTGLTYALLHTAAFLLKNGVVDNVYYFGIGDIKFLQNNYKECMSSKLHMKSGRTCVIGLPKNSLIIMDNIIKHNIKYIFKDLLMQDQFIVFAENYDERPVD